MKRVLITGANGFIGRHCLPILIEHGYEVHAVSTKEILNQVAGVIWHQVDLLNMEQTQALVASVKPSHLLHLAWYTEHKKYWTSELNLSWVQASLALLKNFAQQGGERIVTAGTCAEYDWNYGYCSESITPLVPTTLYGICKNSLQSIQTEFCKQINLSSAWGRIFYLYGPYEDKNRLLPQVIRSLLAGEPARTTQGNQIRDFLYIVDAAHALITLLDSEVLGPINIASGKPVALRELILNIAGGIEDQINLVQLGSISTPLNDPHFIVADVNYLTNKVGWLPRFEFGEGLDLTIRWWREQLASL